MVQLILSDPNIPHLCCLGAELHLKKVLKPAVGIVIGVGIHLAKLKPITINFKWSKTYKWTQKFTFSHV